MGKRGFAGGGEAALVTGASSGIGAAVARALGARGYRVVGTSRREGLRVAGVDRMVRVDLGDSAAVTEFMEAEAALLGAVGILVNCAGAAEFGDLAGLTGAGMEEELQLLLGTPARLTAAVLPGMRERGHGWVVQVSSLAAVFPLPYLPLYSAGKAGLSQLTGSLALTERGGGVGFLDVQAGDFRTAFNERLGSGGGGAQAARVRARLEALLEAGPEPERAARAIVRALERGRSGRIRPGGWFQCVVAPMGARVLPLRCLLWMVRRYYGIGGA